MTKYEVYMKEGNNTYYHIIEADGYHRYNGDGLKLEFRIGNKQIALFDEDQVVAIIIKESE